MTQYDIIAATDEATVVSAYTPAEKSAADYQSEAALEQDFIKQLESHGYGYITINDEASMKANLRYQIELLNSYEFSDDEWERFFNQCIAAANEGIIEKTRRIQDDSVQVLKRDDGSTKNITLIDKKNIHNNRLQVINQYTETEGKRETRYDVTILVNGLPLVHIELKRRGVAIREAFNQIKRYQRDSFWAASGLFEYVQIFVISNGTNTKYYSNTTRAQHIKEGSSTRSRQSKKTSNSFEFTSYWADGENRIISDLVDFTKTFFTKHALLNILVRYCVFTSEELLMVMRPYQIAATERILNRIEVSANYKKTGSIEADGYIWHTTGSGKTLTSFKTAQLATRLSYIDKVLFVVDRKDLDYQTMKEYDRFEKGAANSNTSTKVLQKQLENPDARIIITTIQKLDTFIKKNKGHAVFNKHVVIIFDECHRSQFGDMHGSITKSFKKYHIFGFTGTPIFAVNAGRGGKPHLRTTPQAFGDKLHTYTIVDAIRDSNVLPFRIDYVNTGLIQAFSRTNRILNSVKTFGNIVCFRDLKKATDDAISLFGDSEAGGIVLLKTYDDYYNGYEENDKFHPGYTELIELLLEEYPLGTAILGEESQKDFILLFGAILHLKNILSSFDQFTGNELLSERQFQDYQSIYIDLYQDFTKGKDADKENINDDIVFEIELIKQVEVNIDYILMLVEKYHDSNCTDKSILAAIDKAVSSSIELRSKKELVQAFISRVNTDTKVDEDWQKLVAEEKEKDLIAIISDEKLKEEETRRFITGSFRDGVLKTTGTDIDKVLPPVSRFSKDGGRVEKKKSVIEKLTTFFEKYFGLVQKLKFYI